MGCSSIAAVQGPIKIPISYQISNSCVDQFPIFVIIKVKDKFDLNCRDNINGMLFQDFKKMYQHLSFDQLVFKRLYQFFVDHRNQILKFKMFMAKYATIIKCQDQTLGKIIFQLYKTQQSDQQLSMQDYQKFIQIQRKYFAFEPACPKQKDSLTHNQFFKLLTGSGFYWNQWRNRFNLIQKDDIPFQAINRQLVQNQINDLEIGQSYYVISSSWFQRWSYYYQGQNHMIDQNSIKSSKLLSKGRNSISKIGMNKKIHSKDKRILQHYPSNKSIDDQSLIQQPLRIQTDDIQGQYPGQLKQGLRPTYQCKYLNQKLWKMMITMHPPVQVFRRIATTHQNLQLYPKTIYYFQTHDDGRIDYSTAQRYMLGIRNTLTKLNDGKTITFFVKDFNSKNWSEERVQRMLGQISVGQRFFVIATTNRLGFIQKNTRKQFSKKELAVGDKVYAQFPYEKKVTQAYILSINQRQEKVKIHYIGYSFRYETQVSYDDINFEQQGLKSSLSMTGNLSIASPMKKTQYIYKGIINIGNTCFMNSNLQCLLATPVLDDYLETFKFDKKNAPLMYNITNIARKLLKNENELPYDLKKAVDLNLPAFSGNDQHDAQQFLSLLLDKMSQQHKQKPSVIDQLFSGKIQSKLICQKCQTIKKVEQNFYTLSLPIPQAQYNYYSLIVVPIYTSHVKKIVLKLHKSAKLNDYLNNFQDRINQNKSQFVFTQVVNGTLKKVRTDIMNQLNQNKKLFQIGLAPSNQIYVFQKIKKEFLNQLVRLRQQSDNQFHDYLLQQNNTWGIVKIGQSRKQYHKAQFLAPDNQIEQIKIMKKDQKNLFTLGTKIHDLNFRKLYHRKYNSALKKFQGFGLEMLVGVPKWASYSDITQIIQKTIENLKDGGGSYFGQSGRSRKSRKDLSTLFRFVDPSKLRCIFCDKDLSNATFNEQNNVCCSILQKKIPLYWSTKKKSYSIYVDWISFQKYNPQFFQHIELDNMSQAIQNKKSQQKINLQQCLNLFKAPQKVQMECDKCKNNHQTLQTMIQSVPNILVLHMKQFRYTSQGHLIKLDVRLKWQEFIDISKYSLNDRGTLYQLYAFIRHIGNSQSGHYTCMTKRKHPVQNKKVWVNFDDDITDIVKISKDDIDNAYLLFFKKVDMPTSAYVNFTDLQEMASSIL